MSAGLWYGGWIDDQHGEWCSDDMAGETVTALRRRPDGWSLAAAYDDGTYPNEIPLTIDQRGRLCWSMVNAWGALPCQRVLRSALELLARMDDQGSAVPRLSLELVRAGGLERIRLPRWHHGPALPIVPAERQDSPLRGLLAVHVAQSGRGLC